MVSGLLALVDDVAALVKLSAVTLDDIPAQVAKSGSKVAGIVIDDAAVTPKYLVGLDHTRELAIIWHIARRSVINKLFILGPSAMLLGGLAPWLITPILMLGGAYLCFEGYEKVHAIIHKAAPHAVEAELEEITPEALEKLRVASAVRTDMILSAEIMAITYATVAEYDLIHQLAVLSSIAVGITIAVYGVVGLIVKMDDIGLYLAKKSRISLLRAFGRGLVVAMPRFLALLSAIGTAAMLWVGAEIIIHAIAPVHHALEHMHQLLRGSPVVAWIAKAVICAFAGLLLGGLIAVSIAAVDRLKRFMHSSVS